MNDIRLIAAVAALLLAILGFVLLAANGNVKEADDLLKLVALPSLTFIIGLGSSIVK